MREGRLIRPGPGLDADARLTAERDEIKYLVERSQAIDLARALSRHLPHHRFGGEGANPLSQPEHFVTTIYFDTALRHQYRAARANGERHLKMRAKEYYDVHPWLPDLADGTRPFVHDRPVLWLELKFKDGTRSGKRRVAIPKAQLPCFFDDGLITPELIDLQRARYGGESEAVLREIADHCRGYDEPMQADALVNYRRIPWQDEEGTLRVTLDLDLQFFAPPPDLWQRPRALVRESLGPVRGRLGAAVLELKSRRTPPTWLASVLTAAGARCVPFSKFEAAARAVRRTGAGAERQQVRRQWPAD
jgi:VTC domain